MTYIKVNTKIYQIDWYLEREEYFSGCATNTVPGDSDKINSLNLTVK